MNHFFLQADSPINADEVAEAAAEAVKDPVGFFSSIDWKGYWDKAVDAVISSAPTILLALITIWIGFMLVNWITKLIDVALKKAKVDQALSHFVTSLARTALKVLVVITALSVLGVPMTSFMAILGAAGLAIGLSLKDGLSNFAGGILLLLFKPINIGDLITVGDHHGIVKAIRIFYTVIQTKNDETVTIPNGTLANGEIINYSETPLFRVQALVGIGYDDDIKLAKELMLAQTKKDDRIVSSPEPFVVLKELGDSSVNLELRCWCDNKKARRVLFELYENIKIAFDEAGISIPYPQTDMHVINSGAAS